MSEGTVEAMFHRLRSREGEAMTKEQEKKFEKWTKGRFWTKGERFYAQLGYAAALRSAQSGMQARLVAERKRCAEHGDMFLNSDANWQCICGFVLTEGLAPLSKALKEQQQHIRKLGPTDDLDEAIRKARLIAQREEARYWLSRRAFTGPEEDAVIDGRMQAFDLAIRTVEGKDARHGG
jgi:hypothetical protein